MMVVAIIHRHQQAANTVGRKRTGMVDNGQRNMVAATAHYRIVGACNLVTFRVPLRAESGASSQSV